MTKDHRLVRSLCLAMLIVDTVLLSIVELLFLPLRLDGTVLPNVNALPLPISAVVAAVTMPLMISAAAKVVSPRAAIVPLGVWVLCIVVFGLFGPGGDRVLLADWRTLLLIVAGAFPAAVVLGGVLGAAARSRSGVTSPRLVPKG